MTNIHQIDATTRIRVRQNAFRRVAEYQQKENEEWVTRCNRAYELDIRVNPITDIQRVAAQRGF